jgi:hypothetical protein
MKGPIPIVLTSALFPRPLEEWGPWYTPQEQAWFKIEEGKFLLDGWCSLLMATLPYLSH